MNSPGNGVDGRIGIAEAALWAGAGLVVLTAQLCAAAWLLRERPALPADSAPPPAIMIELAPEPEAVLTQESNISPDQQTAEESTPVDEVEAPDEIPPEEPVEEIAEAEPVEPVSIEPVPIEEELVETIDPVEERIIAKPDKAEVPIPVARPSRPKPEIVRLEKLKKNEPKKATHEQTPRKQTPRRQKPVAASKPAVQAQAEVKRSNRTAASRSVSGLFSSSMTPAKWQSRLQAHLERRKKYPSGARSRGERGVVYVRFRIDNAGNVLSANLAASSGFAELDQEVLALVRRASPVPAPPPGVNKTITAPVRFGAR